MFKKRRVIKKIPVETWDKIHAYREEKRAEALRTDSIDREEAKKAIHELYRSANLTPPSVIVFGKSPLDCLLKRAVIHELFWSINKDKKVLQYLPAKFIEKIYEEYRQKLDSDVRDILEREIGHLLETLGRIYSFIRLQNNHQLKTTFQNDLVSEEMKDTLKKIVKSIEDDLMAVLKGLLEEKITNLRSQHLSGKIYEEFYETVSGKIYGEFCEKVTNEFLQEFDENYLQTFMNQINRSTFFNSISQPNTFFNQLIFQQSWHDFNNKKTREIINQLDFTSIYQDTWFVGAWDYFWLTFYEAGRIIGVEYSPEVSRRLDAYLRYAGACGVCYLYPNIAFVSDRPELYRFDAQNRLHSLDGPAIKWRDGYAIYAWRGIRVPSDVIEKCFERTPQQILYERNAETRRIMMEIYAEIHGPDKFLEDLGGKLISEDVAHGQPRRLYDVNGERFLYVVNGSLEPDGTRRKFILGAHPDATTPHMAVAESYGRATSKYREAVRT